MNLLIKIFLCLHNFYSVVPIMCTPIQCGTEIKPYVNGAIPDNIGENISEKNQEYCELTAQYYAWKNEVCDYYGFCHYRRFFCFDDRIKKTYLPIGRLKEKQNVLFGSETIITELCRNYEIILPRAEDMGISVAEHYRTSAFHDIKDLKLFLDILYEKYPELTDSAKAYLSQNRQYFCNMFLMDWQHFNEYCGYLFGILEEFDRRKIRHGSFQADRTDGYLGERFVGIYLDYARRNGAKIKEIARIDINCTLKKRLGYYIFPPESKRRFFTKKVVKNWRNRKV